MTHDGFNGLDYDELKASSSVAEAINVTAILARPKQKEVLISKTKQGPITAHDEPGLTH